MVFDLNRFALSRNAANQQAASDPDGELPTNPSPLAGTPAQANQRLQVGLSGLGIILLLLVVVDVVVDRTAQTEAEIVPESAATTAVEDVPAPQNDPLADAGVVPDLPVEPVPTPTPDVLPTGQAPEAGQGINPMSAKQPPTAKMSNAR